MPTVILQTPRSELEVETSIEPAAELPDAGLLLVHPYSGLGGSMHDPIIAETFRQAVAGRTFAVVLRYNQRGVGRSSGSRFSLKNLRGQEDAADVFDILEYLKQQLTGTTKRIFVLGYSFGACLAAHVLDHPNLAAYIGISYPLGGLSFLLQTKALFDRVCKASHVPRLLVVGSQDQYTKEEAIWTAVSSHSGVRLQDDSSFDPVTAARESVGGGGGGGGGDSAIQGATKKPLLLKVAPDEDHFWGTNGAAMVEFCLAYCAQIGR